MGQQVTPRYEAEFWNTAAVRENNNGYSYIANFPYNVHVSFFDQDINETVSSKKPAPGQTNIERKGGNKPFDFDTAIDKFTKNSDRQKFLKECMRADGAEYVHLDADQLIGDISYKYSEKYLVYSAYGGYDRNAGEHKIHFARLDYDQENKILSWSYKDEYGRVSRLDRNNFPIADPRTARFSENNFDTSKGNFFLVTGRGMTVGSKNASNLASQYKNQGHIKKIKKLVKDFKANVFEVDDPGKPKRRRFFGI